MSLLDTTKIACPYCGECVEIVIDHSIQFQKYTEDCYVCCHPMHLTVSINSEEEPHVQVNHQDE